MTRLWLIAPLAAIFLALAPAVARAESAADWTRAVYARAAEEFNALFEHRERPQPAPDPFSPTFRAAEAAARAAPPPPVGPILNQLFGWLHFPVGHLTVLAVETRREDAASADVVVDYTTGDERRHATVKERRAGRDFVIDDVAFEDGDSDLAYFRRRVAGSDR